MIRSFNIESITFHRNENNNNATVNYVGPNTYTIPAGMAVAAVLFTISEHNGSGMQLTEIVRLPAEDYNDIVSKAYAQLKTRLEGLGEAAKLIEPDKDEGQPSE